MGLGVRVPAASLFHEDNFAFFDFEVRGTPKFFANFHRGSAQNFEKSGDFARRREGVLPQVEVGYGAKRHSQPKPRAKPLRSARQNPHFFQNFVRNP